MIVKDKILFFIKTPPPITGATLMNERISHSSFFKNKYNIQTIKISYAKSIKDLGRINFFKIKMFFKNMFLLIKKIILFRPDLIYFQISTTGFSFVRDSFYVFIMKIFRIKIVFHVRSKGVARSANSFFIKYYYKLIFRNVYSICLSELMVADIKDVCNINPYVVYNGYPKKDLPNRNKIKNNILFLSNLLFEKGIIDYLDALEIVRENKLKFSGTIVGEEGDVDKKELMKEIKNRNLEDYVNYLGPLYGDEKYNVYMEAEIFVFPTFYKVETFGGVVIEAMQSKLPVITTNIASLPLIVENEKTGFIVQKNNPEQIAKKIIYLINNEGMREIMGNNGYNKFLKYFTFEKYENNMHLIFNKILSN